MCKKPTTEHQTCQTKTDRTQEKQMYAISQLDTSTICIKNEHNQQAESSKDAAELNNTINQLNIIASIDYLIQQQQNTPSFPAHIEHSPGLGHNTGFPGGSEGKESACNTGTRVKSLGWDTT